MVSCSVSVMVRFWMGFVSLEVDMGTYLRVEEYEGFGWCVLISGGLLFVAMLLRDGKALWLLAVVKALIKEEDGEGLKGGKLILFDNLEPL
ncbi:hypothetical protein Tco_0530642 [Tanacetum coccineum]